MRFDRTDRRRRGPGLTSLIDVVFLLLVFFMLATRFDRESVLPLVVSGATAEQATTEHALRIEIGPSGQATIDGRAATAERILREAAQAERDGRKVRVRPDPETRLQPIIDVLGQLSRAGVTDAALERGDNSE